MREEALPPGRDLVRVVPALAWPRRRSRRRGVRRPRGARVVPLAVCATPIGNLEDVTLRVLRELAEADLVLCEDTRRTKILLERHGIQAKLLSYHEHNEAERTAQVLPRLESGERIALTSDAGLPGVSDPGARLIEAALEAGVPVTVLPGPSAVETALVASGLLGEQYRFLGYLPRGGEGAGRALGGARPLASARGRLRVAPAAACEPRLIGGPLARAAGRRLPRADEALRGGRPWDGGRGRGEVHRAAEGRDHARRRRRVRWSRATRGRRSPPSRSSSRPESGGDRRPTSSLGSRACPGIASTAARCSQI